MSYTVWCVFDSDGYECSSFVAAFSTQDKAIMFAQKLMGIAAQEFSLLGIGGEDARRISVRPFTLDEEPHDLYLTLETLRECARSDGNLDPRPMEGEKHK